MQITLLEDDPAQAGMLIGWLSDEGHNVRHFDRGRDLIKALPEQAFDLMILDWELPDTTGIEVLQQVRHRVGWEAPILFVTQRDAETDIVKALDAGADDYMIKQIARGEFLSRVKALSRRLATEPLEFAAGPYRFYPETLSATHLGEPVDLTAKDFELAWFLFRSIGRLLSREELLKEVWKVSGLNTRTVDVHISRIRKRLKIVPESGFRIRTIYQHGYRLEEV